MSVVDFEVHLDQSENIELEGAVDGQLQTIKRKEGSNRSSKNVRKLTLKIA